MNTDTMTQRTHPGFEDINAKGEARAAAAHARKMLARDTKHVNDFLYDLGRAYQLSIPLDRVNDMLLACNFDELEPMILCGRDGRINEPVGRGKYLTLVWHKMESGRYEVVAYIN